MININIQTLITFIAVNLDDAYLQNIDEYISEYQQIKPIEDPIFWLSCGAFICLMSGLIFADIMKSKLNKSLERDQNLLKIIKRNLIFKFIQSDQILF